MSIGIEVEHPVEHMFMLKWTYRITNKMSKVSCKTITYES